MNFSGTILAVDDNPVNLEVYRELLADDYSLYTADSGAKALSMIERVRPDLILLDVMMPGMDGFETCRRLRQYKGLDTKIILVSAAGEVDERLAGYQSGADDYLLRPFDQDEFLAKVGRQIREHVRVQDRLRQAQKLEAVGQLAAGVAHDFNNLLVIISGYSQLLLRDFILDPTARSYVFEIEQAGERAAALTRQLLAFSRKSALQPRVLDLNAIVSDCLQMLQRLVGEHIQIVTRCAPGLESVSADQAQLEQALINLVVNARDAMPQGGTLVIETDNLDVPDPASSDRAGDLPPGAYVMLAVTDSGFGMDDEVKKHLFEPFFTTKGPGKGTGLGLATVHGFILQSGGYVDVASTLGVGTTIRLLLPRCENALVQDEPVTEESPRQGHETILLIEDDDVVRGLIRRFLTATGYTVLQASNGPAAVSMVELHPGTIHLLVCDVVMPYMSGPCAIDQIRKRHPAMKTLYISGYSEDILARHGLPAEAVVLQKPFSPGVLASRVSAALQCQC
jgi:signal transduction histidine kinase